MRKQTELVNGRLAAIEIDSTRLHVCVSSRAGDGPWQCQTLSTVWREEATSLNCERGQLEITEALRRISSELKLHGVPTCIALQGGYCVTLVVTGDEERVRSELAELEQRSSLYLSLGHGPKSLAASVHQIDARHRHALLSVVNRKTLEIISGAAGKVGLQLERIEPSLVSLCRFVGKLRLNDDPPALIVSVDEQGVDVGISHRGLLLLDYRPANAENPQQVAATVLRHHGRLRRYCRRHVGLADDQLSDIYLTGHAETVSQLREAFAQDTSLTIHEVSDPFVLDDEWQGDDSAPSWTMAGPLGLAMLRDDKLDHTSPNLLERINAEAREPISKLLRPLFLPLAATLAAIVAGWCAVGYEGSRVAELESEYAALDIQLRDARLLQRQVMTDQQMLGHYQTIGTSLRDTDWALISKRIAQCLPADAWLDGFSLGQDGQLQLSGGSYGDDGVFEFVRFLGDVPELANVAINGTQPARFGSSGGTSFDVHAELAEQTNEGDRNDDRS